MDPVQYCPLHVAPGRSYQDLPRGVGREPVYRDIPRDDLEDVADEADLLFDRAERNVVRHLFGHPRAFYDIKHVELYAPRVFLYGMDD